MFGRKARAETARDPVCGMDVEPMKAAGTFTHGGKPYYFCSKACLETFTAQPAKHAD